MMFLGLTFMTEVIKNPTLKMYWKEDPVSRTPVFFKAMAQN
jgi:hypothetical protein